MVLNKISAIGLMFMLVLSSIGFIIFSTDNVNATGENWLGDYQYRKEITIGSHASITGNYQFCISVEYGSGTDHVLSSGTGASPIISVYVNGHCRSDFLDVDFTGPDGITTLSYFRYYYSASSQAIFWVKYTGGLTSGGTIFIYYGNSGDSINGGSAHNVFNWYDDFEADADSRFTGDTAYTNYANGYLLLTDSTATRSIYTTTTFSIGKCAFIHGYMTYASGSSGYGGHWGFKPSSGNYGVAMASDWDGSANDRAYTGSGTWTSQTMTAGTLTTNQGYEITWTPTACKYYAGGTLLKTITSTIPTGEYPFHIRASKGTSGVCQNYVYELFIREYVANEPTATSFGAETPRPISPTYCIITSSITTTTVNKLVYFNATVDNSPTLYTWNFGDGNTSSSPSNSTSHTWTTDGTFNVTCNASNPIGYFVGYIIITITEIPPTYCNITVSDTSVFAIEPIYFNATSDQTISECNWDFGDGQTASGVSVVHHWLTSGTFTVNCNVSNSGGYKNNAVNVTVVAPYWVSTPVTSVNVSSVYLYEISYQGYGVPTINISGNGAEYLTFSINKIMGVFPIQGVYSVIITADYGEGVIINQTYSVAVTGVGTEIDNSLDLTEITLLVFIIFILAIFTFVGLRLWFFMILGGFAYLLVAINYVQILDGLLSLMMAGGGIMFMLWGGYRYVR